MISLTDRAALAINFHETLMELRISRYPDGSALNYSNPEHRPWLQATTHSYARQEAAVRILNVEHLTDDLIETYNYTLPADYYDQAIHRNIHRSLHRLLSFIKSLHPYRWDNLIQRWIHAQFDAIYSGNPLNTLQEFIECEFVQRTRYIPSSRSTPS